MTGLRHMAKRAARFAASAIAPLAWRGMAGPRLVVLMYHRVLPRDHIARSYEQAGMFVSPESLRMHVQELRKHFEVMHLEDWVDRSLCGEALPRLACALTFDDGWRDNYEFGYPILRELQVPATIYLVSDLVGKSYGFWPTRIARALATACASGREDVLAHLRKVTDVEIAELDETIGWLKAHHDDARLQGVADELESMIGSAAEPELMSWEQIAEMQASGLVRFGSHTRRHTRLLPGLDASTAVNEILGSAEVLEQRLGVPVNGFCYPNGDDAPEAVELVSSRYSHAVTTRHGWNGPHSDLSLLRRVGVHDDVSNTPRKFLARLALGI